jgi:hypothetical protein
MPSVQIAATYSCTGEHLDFFVEDLTMRVVAACGLI